MLFYVRQCISKLHQTSRVVSCSRSLAVKPPAAGEWIVSPCPDVEFILHNRKRYIQSIIKRLYVRKDYEAEEMLESVADTYENFLESRKDFMLAETKFNGIRGSSASHVEFLTSKNNLSLTKSHYTESICELTDNCLRLPNILHEYDSYIDATNTWLKQRASKKSGENQPLIGTIENGGLEYLTGPAAQKELDIIKETAKYLNSKLWVEVTCPSFIRKDVLDIIDYSSDEIPEIQSKKEMHQRPGAYAQPVLERKLKPEDSHIYLLTGVHELSLMLMFMRENIQPKTFPIKLFSIGNRYQDSTLGLPAQTRIISGLVIVQCEESAMKNFSYLLVTIREILHKIGLVNIKVKATPNHQLHSHEAAAATFYSSNDPIAKISSSLSYISSRIQAFQQTKSSEKTAFKPVYMLTCDFINIGSAVRLPF